ncbi:MAG: Rieske 2Fe-2S domain-containing protein [Deltaproteobacteria bacterium]|nr:Rieske 2Fe-2S domain-containing protein [Deltaproteobacteria bacterium]
MRERLFLLGRKPTTATSAPAEPPEPSIPDWQACDPREISQALGRALARPSGGWVVLDATRAIQKGPRKYVVNGRELVAWWCKKPGHEGTRVGPDHCPHMGAELSKGSVDREGRIVCPWHGWALSGETPKGTFRPLVTFDDGVLSWVRVPELVSHGEALTDRPYLPERPRRFLDATIRVEARCEPRDVIANRLDPWHGAHFHPHSFANLRIVDRGLDHITARVVYRIASGVGMEVDARFDSPEPRTIVMTIVAGEGIGSIVETHATPISDGRTAIIEATLATSERGSVISWLPAAGRLLRPLVEARAKKLWLDDAEYCERTYSLRREKAGRQDP